MTIDKKLKDIGIDIEDKEMYELAKFIWEEAQKDYILSKSSPKYELHILKKNVRFGKNL